VRGRGTCQNIQTATAKQTFDGMNPLSGSSRSSGQQAHQTLPNPVSQRRAASRPNENLCPNTGGDDAASWSPWWRRFPIHIRECSSSASVLGHRFLRAEWPPCAGISKCAACGAPPICFTYASRFLSRSPTHSRPAPTHAYPHHTPVLTRSTSPFPHIHSATPTCPATSLPAWKTPPRTTWEGWC